MKRIIGILSAALLLFSLGACSSSNASQGSSDNGKTTSTSSTVAVQDKTKQPAVSAGNNGSKSPKNSSSCSFQNHNGKNK